MTKYKHDLYRALTFKVQYKAFSFFDIVKFTQ